jgi:putative ABC transport system permease protein
MGRFDGIRRWLRLPRRSREGAAQDVDAEVDFHLAARTRDLEAQGLAAEEARERAQQEFGDVERLRSSLVPVAAGVARRARRRQWRDDLRRDVKFGWRKLVSNPSFAAVAILTLATGIGSSTAIFSVVNGVLLRPLPWVEPSELVMVWENDRFTGTVREPASVPDYYDFRDRSSVFAELAFFVSTDANLAQPGAEPERVRIARVTHELFPMLGVAPLVGRGFSAEEDSPGGPQVALVSESFWRARLGGGSALGGEIRLNDVPYVVVGVMPDEVEFPSAAEKIWVPAQLGPTSMARFTHPILVVGRLLPGTTLTAAQRQMTRIAADLEAEYPTANSGRGVFVEPVLDVTFADSRPALLVLLGGVVLLLVIACANVASLLLARGLSRSHEVAVRSALGAGRGRLARQFLVESVMLTFVSAALGVVIARAGLGALVSLMPAEMPRLGQVALDGRVLGVAVLVAGVVGILFGFLPTLQARRTDVQSVLRTESNRGASAGRSKQVARNVLVIGEVAISFVLVIGAALLMRTVMALRNVDPGFQADNVVRLDYNLPESRYARDFSTPPPWTGWPHQLFFANIFERLPALPGVESVALSSHHPLAESFTNSFVIVGREDEVAGQPEMVVRGVSHGYVETLGVPLLEGRAFEERDRAEAPPVLMINEAGSRRFFPDGSPIGERVAFWGQQREIVGVIGNQHFNGLAEEAPAALYVPLAQVPMNTGSILVRTSGDPLAVAAEVRAAVRGIDPELAVFDVATLDQTILQSISRERSTMLLLAVFAAIALLLALIGVHGVLSYTVSQRTRELGVRMALGATSRDVLALVVRQGVALALVGVGIGLIGALAGARLLSSLLFGVTPTDPATFLLVTVVVLVVAAAASWTPARRALAVDPIVTLRTE